MDMEVATTTRTRDSSALSNGLRLALTGICLIVGQTLLASEGDDAIREMARKAQDPLADIKAIMTDNTIGFNAGPGENDTAYGFQLQPVYAIPTENMNMILRAVVPIVGVEQGVVIPPLGPDGAPIRGDKWGISDPIIQYFFSPKSDSTWKWGVGPQVSLKMRSSDRQAGAGWGAGVSGVVFGAVGNWALGAIAMQHWGTESDFSLATLQPIILYNIDAIPGAYVGYNNSITYNWNADSDDKLTFPLGLTAGRTILVGNNGLDLSIGAYKLVERPDGAADWQFKFGISYFFN
jgi:hypothetical protein